MFKHTGSRPGWLVMQVIGVATWFIRLETYVSKQRNIAFIMLQESLA